MYVLKKINVVLKVEQNSSVIFHDDYSSPVSTKDIHNTALENYDFTNKNVYLFSTNGGSGLAGTVETIKNKLSNTKVEKNAFKLHRNSMKNASQEVDNWIKKLGFQED